MDLSSFKEKKPWFVPKWLWNMVINNVCDVAKSTLKVDVISVYTAEKVMEGLEAKIKDKDDKSVDLVCTALEKGSQFFVEAAAACKDKVVTDEEKVSVGAALGDTIKAFVSQEAIDSRIEEVREALVYA